MAMMLYRDERGRSSGRSSFRPMSEINVTPMVDVMLVLLVVFMITAPLLTVGVPVDLPKTQAAQIVGEDEPIVVTVNARGTIFIQETEIEFGNLATRLKALTRHQRNTRIFVRGDRKIAYGRVMQIMGLINQAGFTRVALITELPSSRKARSKSR